MDVRLYSVILKPACLGSNPGSATSEHCWANYITFLCLDSLIHTMEMLIVSVSLVAMRTNICKVHKTVPYIS